LTLATRRCSS